jgi:hypothetical protein
MKGLNVRKLAAVAVGGALVGSALAPLAAAIDVSKSDVVGPSGVPVVSVVAGSGASVSDVVWAGNIAAKVAQLATVDTAVTGGEGTAEPSGLSVDLAVGGDTSYSSEYSKTYDGTSYGFTTATTDNAEFIKSASSGQLPFLMNTTKSYRYNGSTYNIAVKETVGIEADALFVTQKSIKDLVVYMETVGDFNYVLDLGDGIPSDVSTTDRGTKFTDGANDNVIIPFLGEEFTVQEVDMDSSTRTINLIKESSKANYNEGDTIPGLIGKGSYAGEEMSVKISAVTQSSATATYEARFELADSEGNIVDSQTLGSATYLNKNFLDSDGAYALETVVYISAINVEPTTSKGVLTMVVGKNVVTLAHSKQYPYDSTDTDTTDDYWTSTIDQNSGTTSVAVNTVTKITVKNKVQAWNLSSPVWSSDDSVTQAGKDAAAAGGDTAHFLQGEETGLGYDFVKVKFDGFKYDQDKTTIKVGNGNVVYNDSDNTRRTIPFFIQLPEIPQSEPTEQTFSVDNVSFYAKCYKPSSAETFDIYDGNYLNGALVTIKTAAAGINISDDNRSAHDIADSNTNNVDVDLNGVQFTATSALVLADGVGGARLEFDGNCSYSSTSWEATATYLQVNGQANINQITATSDVYKTMYFDDSNGSRTPGDLPVYFTKDGSLADTYRYRQYYSGTDGYVYLLLDNTTNFSNSFSNADVNFVGTDPIEAGDVGLGDSAGLNYYPYYWPDNENFGSNDATDNSFIVAIFGAEANGAVNDDFRIHIDTATGNLIEFPNDQLSNYTADVNVVSQVEPAWALKARTDTESALHAGWIEYGSKAELTDDMETVTFTIPEAQIYLSLSILGEGAVTTVTGGETAEAVKSGETVTIAGKDITVAAINYAAGTCTVAGSTYPKIMSVGQLVYTDSPAPAGNHVIVGGYLVNKLAENVLLGDGSTLQEALTAPGDKVAELLSNGNIVVAGYTAADTKAAAQELIAALDMLA